MACNCISQADDPSTSNAFFQATLAVPRHFLEATGILNGGEGSIFRWNQGKKRKPNVNMFHRSKTQVVFFFGTFQILLRRFYKSIIGPMALHSSASWSCSKKISTSCGCLPRCFTVVGAYSLFSVHRGLEPMTAGASH